MELVIERNYWTYIGQAKVGTAVIKATTEEEAEFMLNFMAEVMEVYTAAWYPPNDLINDN